MLIVMSVKPTLTDELITTQSEFCFEINILCDRRSVQWRTLKFEMRKTALQNKLTLKLVNKQPSGFRFHQVLR